MNLGLGLGLTIHRILGSGGGGGGGGEQSSELLGFLQAKPDAALWDVTVAESLFLHAVGSTPAGVGTRVGRLEDLTGHGKHCTQPDEDQHDVGEDVFYRPLVSNDGTPSNIRFLKPQLAAGMPWGWMAWPFDDVVGTFGFASPFGHQIGHLPYGTTNLPVVFGSLMFFIPGAPLEAEELAFLNAQLAARFPAYRDGISGAYEVTANLELNQPPFTDGDFDPDELGTTVTLDFDSASDAAVPDDFTGGPDDYMYAPYWYGSGAAGAAGQFFDIVLGAAEDLVAMPALYGTHGQLLPIEDLTTVYTSLQVYDARRSSHEGFLPQSVPTAVTAQFYSSDVGNGIKGLVGSIPVNLGNTATILYSIYGQRITGPLPDITGCMVLQTLQLQHNPGLTGYESAGLPGSLKYLGCYDTGLTVADRTAILAHLRAAAVTACTVEIDFDGLSGQALDDIAWLEANGGNTVIDR